jgi:16S rRNA (guanine(527)-N(7))-methyltransferase RsmG
MLPTYWKDSPVLSENALEKLQNFASLILQWNAKINLTGYRGLKEVEELLIGESVLAAEALQKSGMMQRATKVLDFGSGAGIPGLVWASLDLPVQVTSLEIRQKKVAFQKEVSRQLHLKARIVSGRFPEAVGSEAFDLIVSRAIRYDPGIWKQGERCLTSSGSFVRFATADFKEPGWSTISVSDKSSLLVKTRM